MRRSWLLIQLSLTLGLALVFIGMVSPVAVRADESEKSNQRPISGRVVQVSQVTDLFVHLDTDDDGRGDLWAKVESDQSELVDALGNPASATDIAIGVFLTLTDYEYEDGYYKVKRAVVGQGQPQETTELGGIILTAFAFGEHTLTLLDLDDDGFGDLTLKVKHTGLILDPQGNSLDESSLLPDVRLRALSSQLDAQGAWVTWHVVVGEGSLSAEVYPKVEGTVRERYELGGVEYVLLAQGPGGPRMQSRGPNESAGWLAVRLGPGAHLQDESGNALSLAEIQVGAQLSVSQYTVREGYFDAQLAILRS